MPRSHLVDLMEFAEQLQAKHGFPIACFGHAGDGNIHVNIMADRYNRDAAVREKVERALDDLFAQVLAWGGVITGEHGIGLAKKRWWPEATSEVVRDAASSAQTSSRSKRNFESGKICLTADVRSGICN